MLHNYITTHVANKHKICLLFLNTTTCFGPLRPSSWIIYLQSDT
jgi:hypothetical protein